MSVTPEAIDACLPQTQCTRCGYPRCRAYAEALAAGTADLNRCPPGSAPTIAALAQLLQRPALALDPACGFHEPRTRARIDEALCIGCRKCIDVCPVDAILGARKWMHTVLAAECNGCALCLPACPVDCIALVAAENPPAADSLWPEYTRAETQRWRARSAARLVRLARKKRGSRASKPGAAGASDERARIRAEIRAAVARVKARRAKSTPAA
jgi:electron transport complex protein RnfB